MSLPLVEKALSTSLKPIKEKSRVMESFSVVGSNSKRPALSVLHPCEVPLTEMLTNSIATPFPSVTFPEMCIVLADVSPIVPNRMNMNSNKFFFI